MKYTGTAEHFFPTLLALSHFSAPLILCHLSLSEFGLGCHQEFIVLHHPRVRYVTTPVLLLASCSVILLFSVLLLATSCKQAQGRLQLLQVADPVPISLHDGSMFKVRVS